MASRPTLQDGFLGAQPRFGEVKLETKSHKKAEFKVSGENCVEIKLKAHVPVKTVTKLTQCGKGQEIQGHVLAQRQEGEVIYHVAFPENGFFTFSIFALPESEAGEQLPGVFNYLIEVDRNFKPTYPYVKVYTKFYTDYCFLDEPKFLSSESAKKLDKVKFQLKVPGAKKVAVHAGEEWFQLKNRGGNEWEGSADLQKYKGKSTKVTVNGCYDDAGTSYSVLLEYNI